MQQITDNSVELAYVDQGYTGENAKQTASAHGIELEVVKHTEAKRGFILLPRRCVVERSFAWAARFRRLARDYERLAETVAGYHFLAFACLKFITGSRAKDLLHVSNARMQQFQENFRGFGSSLNFA